MANHANIESPLVAGPTVKLEALFADWTYVPVGDAGGRHYPAPAGYYLFCGLPGSLRRDRALFVKPHEAVRLAAECRLTNGVIGAFRCVRSARYMKDDLLPVYVSDPREDELPDVGLMLAEDLETGEWIEVDTRDPRVREHYRRTVAQQKVTRDTLFRRLGLDAINVATHRPYITALAEFFRRRARRMHAG